MPEFELKKQWPIIFAVDTSGSMAGSRLSQLNEALQELTCMLEIVADQMEVELSMRLIEFNTEARWLVGGVRIGCKSFRYSIFRCLGWNKHRRCPKTC